RRPRPLKRAVDRSDAVTEQPCDLLRRPTEHLAEEKRSALLRRQELHRGDEGQLDALAELVARLGRRGAATQFGEEAVGIRLEMRELLDGGGSDRLGPA